MNPAVNALPAVSADVYKRQLLDRVKRDDIALFTSPLSVYEIAIKVQDVLNA